MIATVTSHTLFSSRMETEVFDIVTAIRNGSQVAFKRCFDDHYAELCRHAWSFLREKEEAEEVVQQVFVTFWEKKDRIEIESSLRAYLFRSVRNACLNVLKHRKVVLKHESESAAFAEEGHAHDHLVSEELEIRIGRALHNLPQQCGLVFRMSRMEGLSYREIAEQLGISVKTVENHMGKALSLLRTELAEYLPVLLLILSSFHSKP